MATIEEKIKGLKSGKVKGFAEMAAITGDAIAEGASRKAWVIFNDKKFRQVVGFDNLPQIERDRIFNELILAALVMIMLTFETPDLRTSQDFKDYLRLVKEEIPRGYTRKLKEIGIERRFRRDWEKLIEMRHKEYQRDQQGIREAAMEIKGKEESNLSINDLDNIQILLPVQAAAFGCHHHIRRGKLKGEKDKVLINLIVRWLGKFYIEIRALTEGKKITLFKRLKVKLRRFFR